MHVSILSARFCRLSARTGQFWAPLLCGGGNKRSASSSQRANSLVPSAIVGVAISNSAIMGAISTFSIATFPPGQWPIDRSTGFGRAERFETESGKIPRSVVAHVLCAKAFIRKSSAADGAPLAGVSTGGMSTVPFDMSLLYYCVRWGWFSTGYSRDQTEPKKQG